MAAIFLTTAAGAAGGDSASAMPADEMAAKRASAASLTAQSDRNACAAAQPFYWEIGDAAGKLASGSVERPGSRGPTYTAASVMQIASASKWLYGSYVVQRRGGVLSDADVKSLTLRSGYTNFRFCLPRRTVGQCLDFLRNGVHSADADGKFFYNGGHMQQHASSLGLAALGSAALADEIRSQLGSDIALTYVHTQLAGGAVTSAEDYARFLRKILDGRLAMRSALGSDAVCTNPATCASAVYTPTPPGESWHYSIGHWVEDDPSVGDGAFSSPGAFGFYPWIDASKTTYGVIARKAGFNGYLDSAKCGRLLRKAWFTATAQ